MADSATKLVAGEAARVAAEGGWLFRPLDQIAMTGADRVRFLNGQVTCDVKSPAPGAAYGYFTSAKGRVESEVAVLIESERLRLLLPPGQGEPILARLRKYLIADRVELALERIAGRWVICPEERLAGLGGAAGEPPALRGPNLGLTRDLGALLQLPPEGGGPPAPIGGLGEIAEGTWQQLRIEAGRAEFGRDFGPEHFPQEVGVEQAVSYTKGCYLGQEIVARIHYRGGVQRHLRGLRITAEAPLPDLPLALRLEGQEVGKLTSLAPLPRGGHFLGLGIVHKKAEPGSFLELNGVDGKKAGAAEVVALPFS